MTCPHCADLPHRRVTLVQRSAACAAVDSWARAWGYIAAESWLVRRGEADVALVMAAELFDHCDAMADVALAVGEQLPLLRP